MPKVLYVATVVKTHIMEFHIPYLKMLKEMGWETAVAARNDYEDSNECLIPYCDQYFDIPFERNPLKIHNIKAYRVLKRIIDNGNYDIIHCHTPVGAMIARLAAQDARRNGCKVIYTAHGFHFYTGAPLINWIVYYTVEKWLAPKTDVLITINKEDYERAKRKLKAGKVEYVPGVGIDTKKFSRTIGDREQKRKELGLKDSDFVILSVGELIARKNHMVVLEALAEMKDEINNSQYLVCGRGEMEKELKDKAAQLGIADHVRFLGYRTDISEICTASDLFVFPSLQEGLPVALMEAMACGLPVICSNIRGNTDLVMSGVNGEIVEITDIAESILKLKNNKKLRDQYGYAAISTIKHFDLTQISSELRDLYVYETAENELGGVRPKYLLNVIRSFKLKQEFGIPVDKTVLLSVGEVNKNKNHRVVIEALLELPEYYYVICGRGPLMEAHKRIAEMLGVADRLILTGYRNDIQYFYYMADIFVFPSKREGLPVALMEAMASDIPCIAAKNRGTKDLITEGRSMFTPSDIRQIIKCIKDCQNMDKFYFFDYHERLKKFDIISTEGIFKKIYEESQCDD